MSLSATHVRAYDGYFYEEPVLQGEGWFICFDDDDPPELVIAKDSGLKPGQVMKMANVGARKIKLHDQYAARDFSQVEGTFDFRDANAYWFELYRPLDPKKIAKHDGRSKQHPMGVFYDFNGKWNKTK